MTNSKLDLRSFLPQIFLFNSLSIDELDKVISISTVKRFEKNTQIFSQGDEVTAFYIIVYGKISIFKVSSNGSEQLIHINSDKDVVAEAAIFGKNSYPACCRTLKESLIVKIPKNDFIDLLLSYPHISVKMMGSYSNRLREFVKMVEYLTLDDVKKRIIKYLMQNSVKSNDGYVSFELEISKREIAGLLGTTPETFSRVLRDLKKNSLISEDKKLIMLNDIDGLKSLL